MPRAPGHLPILGLWLLASGLVLRLTIHVAGAAAEPAHGFVAHYAASRLAIERGDAAALYDDERFIAAVRTFEPGVIDIFGANPPTVALAVLPLVGLEYGEARTLWTLASLVAWLLAVLWLARALSLGSAWTPLLLCVAALFQPAIENLRHAQLHVLVLVLVLVAWYAFRRTRSAPAGIGLGLALALKATGAVFWPLLVVRRQWRALAWGALTVGALAALSVVLLGLDAWSAFLDRASDTAAAGSLSVTAYQTLPGLIRRLTVFDGRWNLSPMLDLGRAGIWLSWVAAGTLLAWSLVAARRTDTGRALAAFAALGLAISPVSLDYHYVLAIFPAAVLIARLRERMASPAGLLALAALAAIALDLPYRSPRLADGALVLLAYPKLYGVLILWWLLLRPGPDHSVIEAERPAARRTAVGTSAGLAA